MSVERRRRRNFAAALAGAAILAAIGGAAAGAVAANAGTTAGATDANADEAGKKPYFFKDGKVDFNTYNGWRRYTETCMRCHGPDGAGSSYAPDLTQSLKSMTKEQFEEVVVNGRQDVTTATENVMPPFGTDPDVMNYIDDIYGYLKARSDGVLGRGRPQHFPKEAEAK